MSTDPRIKMPPYEIGLVNTYLSQEQLRFQHAHAPQIVATLTEDGRLKELEPLIGTENFEIPENIKELAIREFSQALKYHGFDVKYTNQDYLDITKGGFNMRLDTKDQVPFSDVTLHQINMVYKDFVSERNYTSQRTIDMAIHNLENSEKFTHEDVERFNHKILSAMLVKKKSVKTSVPHK